ncbi:MAG: transcriptional regulator [Anaerolineaceae bacterium]|nr:MAG: transcriptional regulator [Anaerolineaceae bacterium]
MDTRSQITIRTKKLGVLIRDARLASRKTLQECAEAVGVTKGIFKSYEEGRRSPSLPELEVLVYFLKLPINHFWGNEAISDDQPSTAPLDLPRLLLVRQRMIGALLRQTREKVNKSVRELSQETGITSSRLKAFELGERPIPVPDLEILLGALDSRVDELFDQSGPVGQWMSDQKAIHDFLKLPSDLRAFASQPVNIPYLELARKLSSMSTDRLRSVAEGLLDITF